MNAFTPFDKLRTGLDPQGLPQVLDPEANDAQLRRVPAATTDRAPTALNSRFNAQ
jgi:hypothetical protein